MNKTLTVLTLALAASLSLSGCGAKDSGAVKTEAGSATNAATAAVTDDQMKDGAAKLLKTAKQINKALTAGDDAKVKDLGPKLEENWSSFEDGVKPKYPDVYEAVEKNLDPLIAGTKASSIDKAALGKLDAQLIQTLYDLSQKLIPVEQVKSDANTLIGITGELKKEIEAGNEAKVKELAPKLEETWSAFEDGVKPRSSELYEKIEKFLNPEVAGAQKSPLDKQALGQLNDGLTQALNELLQTVK